MRIRAVVIGISFGVVLMGCSAISVKHRPDGAGEPSRLPGIPFYTKVAACKHETIWLEQLYRVTLSSKGKVGDKETSQTIGTRIIGYREYSGTGTPFRDFIESFEQLSAEQDKAKRTIEVVRKFVALKNYSVPEQGKLPTERIFASNQNQSEVIVNYGDTHYYNVKKPWVGSASTSFELNQDGTLSKGSAQIEDKTLPTLLSLLPIKEVLTAAAKGIVPAVDAQVEVPLVLTVTIEPLFFKYTLSSSKIAKTVPCGSPGTALDEKDLEKVNFSRAQVQNEDLKKDDEAKKFKFSGSVDLPK